MHSSNAIRDSVLDAATRGTGIKEIGVGVKGEGVEGVELDCAASYCLTSLRMMSRNCDTATSPGHWEVLGVMQTTREAGDKVLVSEFQVDGASDDTIAPAIRRSLERRPEATSRPPLPVRAPRRDP